MSKNIVETRDIILIVDDAKVDLCILRRTLESEGYKVLEASSGDSALSVANCVLPELIILDIMMPGIDGFETCQKLKENASTANIPVIFVTAKTQSEDIVKGFSVGGVDYITKPFKKEEVLAHVATHLKISRLTKDLLENNRKLERRTDELTQANKRLKKEIAMRKEAEEKLAYAATHDALTGLPNRLLFNDRLELAIASAQRNQEKICIMLIDLDQFKEVNDTLGHSAGDQLLQEFGNRLVNLLRKSDTVARIGDDEFILLLPDIKQTESVDKVAQLIIEAIRKPFVIARHEIYITASIGIIIYPENGEDVETLIKKADITMYRAKESGRDCYKYWEETECVKINQTSD